MNHLYIYLAIYILILAGVSYIVSRKESAEGFLIADRGRGSWIIALSKFAGSVGASYLVAYTAYAFEYGIGVYSAVFGMLVGYLIFAFWAAPKINEAAHESKFYTQGDLVYFKTKNSFTKSIANMGSIIVTFMWLMVGVVGGAKLISHIGLTSYEIAVIITAVVIMAYLLLAGFRAVLATDAIQSAIILILTFVLAVVVLSDASLTSVLSADTKVMDFEMIAGFFLFGVLGVYGGSSWYQLCYSGKNKNAVKNGIAGAIIPIIVMTSILLFLGMYIFLQNPELDPALVFLELIQFHLPESMIPLGIVLFFAAIMSSADTNVYAISSHYVLNKQNTAPVQEIKKTIIILTVISIVIAYFFRDVVDITIIAAASVLTFSVPMIYIIFEGVHKSPYRFIGSFVCGIIGMMVGIGIWGIEPNIALTVLVGGLLGLLYNRKNPQNFS